MKIAHLTTVDMSLRYLLMAQLEAARDAGEAIGISAPGQFVPELEAQGIRHLPLISSTRGMAPLRDLRAAFDLWRILKAEQPDVLHTHNPKPGLYGRIVGRLADVPIVVNTVHGLYATADSPPTRRLVAYTLERLGSRFSDAELVQNPEDVDLLRRKRITPAGKIELLGNGVDLDRFDARRAAEARPEVREELGIPEDLVVVGMVGRLVAEKGVPELLEAARRLDSRYRVMIVGPEDEEKGDAIDREAIAGAERAGVLFLGMRKDVERLYGAFDIFVLPSYREGFPRSAMEAAACGLPVVATDIRGCRQVVDHGVNGLLVSVGDVPGLVQAIEHIGSDRGVLERMALASAEKARAEFDEKRVVEKVMTTYRQVAQRKGMGWKLAAEPSESPVLIRQARSEDVMTLARLHHSLIDTGFLSSLGRRFLEVLYGAMIDALGARVLVAEVDGGVRGYVCGVADTGSFYRWFLRKRAWRAMWSVLPRALSPSSIAKIWETLRYGRGGGQQVSAELLAMAVAPSAQGRGIGSQLISGLFEWNAESGVDAMKVVVGADNEAAERLYRRCGFTESREIVIHEGEASLELVWRR